VKIIPQPSATLKHVQDQGQTLKSQKQLATQRKTSNSAADCLTAFKFCTEFHHVTDKTLQMFKVQGQRSRSRRKVMY